MAKLQQIPLIEQRLLHLVMKQLQSNKAELRQSGRDQARQLMRLRKNGIQVEDGEWDLDEDADGEIAFWNKQERRRVGSGVCLDGGMPRWPR